ncbi:hypothetical protein PAMP_018894 [Pampus punctatissimus]
MSETSDPQKLLKPQRREVFSVGALREAPNTLGSHYRRAQTTHRVQRTFNRASKVNKLTEKTKKAFT